MCLVTYNRCCCSLRASRSAMLVRRLKLNLNRLNSLPPRQGLNSLDNTVEVALSECRSSSIRSPVPGEFLNMTLIKALHSRNKAVSKLLIEQRLIK
jgi:hypothetical protein